MAYSFLQAQRAVEQEQLAKIYVVAGPEPFQALELLDRVKKRLIGEKDTEGFNYDSFDADTVEPADLLASLDTLPSLFDAPDAIRLVVCRRFEKASALLLERLEPYLKNPSGQTCFFILADKVDKRKSWLKEVEKNGYLVEVAEPYDRDWPKWRPYFEKRCGKSIEPDAWDLLVDSCRSLSLIGTECEKAALFIGKRSKISSQDIAQTAGASTAEDIFQLSEDIVARRAQPAMLKLHRLLLAGESEIKILAIVLRHLRQVGQCLGFLEKGVLEPKVIGPQIGVPPFFVPKILDSARGYTQKTFDRSLKLLAECDYRLKKGEGSLWADFLVPHFSRSE